jgi:hypothetical protein
MPIKPENRARYPKNWKEIRARIQARAGNKCEFCDVPNRILIYRDRNNDWHQVVEEGRKYTQPMISANWARSMGFKVIEVVCTTAHLDHIVENCSDDNLKFLCQRCHLAYDAKHHAQNSYQTRRKGRALDLFKP